MAKHSRMYNGHTNCDRAGLHTWISALPWQLALRVKHLQLSMLTQADVIGSKVWPTKINTDKGTLKRTAKCYC